MLSTWKKIPSSYCRLYAALQYIHRYNHHIIIYTYSFSGHLSRANHDTPCFPWASGTEASDGNTPWCCFLCVQSGCRMQWDDGPVADEHCRGCLDSGRPSHHGSLHHAARDGEAWLHLTWNHASPSLAAWCSICSFDPKPAEGDWNVAGCHTSLSVTPVLQMAMIASSRFAKPLARLPWNTLQSTVRAAISAPSSTLTGILIDGFLTYILSC